MKEAIYCQKKFSFSVPWEMQREQYGKHEYQCQGVYG